MSDITLRAGADVPVVILAGGQGTRLRTFRPKPMV